MKVLNRFMSALGYMPISGSIGSFALDIDSTSLDAAIAKLGQLDRAAVEAEAAMNCAAASAQFATAELVADETQPLILAELRKHTTLLEVLAKRGEANRRERDTSPLTFDPINSGGFETFPPATGASASGLPG
nr:hypothetical protein [uncultured Duganella sp.]